MAGLLRCIGGLALFSAPLRTISIGDQMQLKRRFSAEEVEKFAQLSGDNNPIHVDPEYAKSTRFGGCIVHAVLVHGALSGLFGSKFPGPGCVYVNEQYDFKAPLFVNEEFVLNAEVKEIKRTFIKFDIKVKSAVKPDKIIMQGYSTIMVDKNQLELEVPQYLLPK